MATSRVAIDPKLPAGTTGWVLQCIKVNDPRLDSCYDDCMVLMEFDVIDEYGMEIKPILVKDSYLEQNRSAEEIKEIEEPEKVPRKNKLEAEMIYGFIRDDEITVSEGF